VPTLPEPDLVGSKTEEDGVVILTLRHPPVNSLSTALLARLAERVTEIEATPTVRAVVLTGEGQYFSAGADVKEMSVMDRTTAPAIVARGQALFSRIERLHPPVVAAVNGLAVGGGLELALACDLRVAGESAKFGALEVSIGLAPAYGGTQRLPRLIGTAKAKELIFTAGMIPASEALKIGLINKMVPAGQELRAARDLAHTIAQKAPKAVQASKRAIQEGRELSLVEGLKLEASLLETEVLPSEDLGEGLAAFIEHRPPKFKGA
jgi:enoyl-CoA hydratase/carnithine racemase